MYLKGVLSDRWVLEFQLLKSVSSRVIDGYSAIERCFEQ